jgi:LysR family cys regulon transcriptional activator
VGETDVNLHQFRFVQEAVRRGLNLTETAKALHTSQPGISKAILELEEELGVDIFARHGKRLRRVTEPGQLVLKSIETIMREVGNLKRIGAEYSLQDAGTLSIATTHTQARYVLPERVAQLRRRYPKVGISLHQGSPEQVAQMLLHEVADIGLATESLADHDELVTLPCYEWQHVIVVPATHPLAGVERPTLEQLAAEPIITYQRAFTGRRRVDAAFAQRALAPNVVLDAIDSDVIKTYVRLGLGVGIVAEMAMHGDAAGDLVAKPAGHLFGTNVARVAFRRGAYLRQFVYAFAELLSDRLGRALIERAMTGGGTHHDL